MGSNEPGVHIMSNLYEIEASSTMDLCGHLKDQTLNIVREIDIGTRTLVVVHIFSN